MGVVDTKGWIIDCQKKSSTILNKLSEYIPKMNEHELHSYLINNGLFRTISDERAWVRALLKQNIWREVQIALEELKTRFYGPDVPVLILPADSQNVKLQVELKGRSGLAHRDIIFLFVSTYNSVEEILALLTHEYHHVARMHHLGKELHEYTLVDSILIEGLAEYAVKEKFSGRFTSGWTRYYNEKQIRYFWQQYMEPYQDIKKDNPMHDRLLYGGDPFPKMLGYAVGYGIVDWLQKRTKNNTTRLIKMPARKILEIWSKKN